MKKILGLTMLTLFFTCCEVGVRTSSAKVIIEGNMSERNVNEYKHVKDGIEYYIFYQFDGGLHVINHTKELLEVELLQLQIDSLKAQ